MSRSSKIILGGFLIRALVAQALFWISYLRLPIARSLQLGNGFWFFGLDGVHYFRFAKNLSARGLTAILLLGDEHPSRFFVQVLSLFVRAFGSVASVAILLNCAAYLLTCVLLLSLTRDDHRNAIALAAIAFSPAWILFSLQPLKDALFLLLLVATIAAFRRWEELWRTGGTRAQFAGCAVAMFVMIYALAGIRWYAAMILWIASAIFFILATLPASRKGWAVAISVALFVLFAQAVRFGALDTPPAFARLLSPVSVMRWRPAFATRQVAAMREGFDNTPGATTIATGSAIHEPETAPAPAPPVPKTIAGRVIARFAAMFLPRILAESLGLMHVDGGRGLWIFAETDTLLFDLVLLYAVVACARSLRRGAGVTATFVLCVLVFVMMAGPMLYTVSNFGTLVRLRMMIYAVAVVLPLTLRSDAVS